MDEGMTSLITGLLFFSFTLFLILKTAYQDYKCVYAIKNQLLSIQNHKNIKHIKKEDYDKVLGIMDDFQNYSMSLWRPSPFTEREKKYSIKTLNRIESELNNISNKFEVI